MATPAVSNPQAAHAGLVTAMSGPLHAAWSTVDVARLEQSLPNLKTILAYLTQRYSLAAASLAARQYERARAAANATGRYTVIPALPPPLEAVGKAVDWATVPLWSGEPNVELARMQTRAAVEKLVLDTGRQTIVDNSRNDRVARGWARIPEPGCCYFCAMLATRGAVYKQQTVDFRSHDHCRCHAEPVFTSYEPSAQIREWQGLYAQATSRAAGMKAAQKAFRHAFTTRYG